MKNFTSFIFVYFIFSLVAFAQIPSGAVGFYTLDGHAFDSSGLANHGTITGVVPPATDRHGNSSGALSFDGLSGHITMGNDPDFQFTDSLTIGAWIFPLQNTEWKGIASKWNGNANGGYYLGINPLTDRIRLNLGNSNTIEGDLLQYGVWMHVAATFDGSTMKIYENGIMVASANASQINNTVASFIIGTQHDIQTNKFFGSIDDLVVYGRALNQAEINQLINQCIPPVLSTSVTDALCFGDSSGTATVNASGGTLPYTYSWSNGETTQTAISLPAGTHTVIVTDDSSCAGIATVSIAGPPAMGATISSSSSNFPSPNCNGSVSATPSGGTPPYTITWSSGSTTNLCQGWYTATITDANNCVLTDSVYVNLVTGIEELKAEGISIYPNPVSNILYIQSDTKNIELIKIFDVRGKLLIEKIINNRMSEIELKELNTGVYFIEINNLKYKLIKD